MSKKRKAVKRPASKAARPSRARGRRAAAPRSPRHALAVATNTRGAVKERVDAPQGDAIPWLLLQAKSVGSPGSFSKTTSVQRVNTVGGVAPKSGCSESAVGTAVQVPYSADYYFLAEKK